MMGDLALLGGPVARTGDCPPQKGLAHIFTMPPDPFQNIGKQPVMDVQDVSQRLCVFEWTEEETIRDLQS